MMFILQLYPIYECTERPVTFPQLLVQLIIMQFDGGPRVWDESLERPGCAFTRSLGDSVAEACGVCAEPEV